MYALELILQLLLKTWREKKLKIKSITNEEPYMKCMDRRKLYECKARKLYSPIDRDNPPISQSPAATPYGDPAVTLEQGSR